jgi:hypothetical protein
MQQKYDFKKLIDNIYYLAKVNRVSIESLEKAIGVSKGFFYRNKVSTTQRSIGVKTVVEVAEFFAVDINDLLYKDLSKDKKEN